MGFLNILSNFKKEFYAISLLTLLALLGKIFGVNLIFDIKLTLSSVFLFIILRLFGLKWALISAVLVNGIEFSFAEQITEPVLAFMEILAVGIVFKIKKKNIILLDTFYWVLASAAVIGYSIYSSHGDVKIEIISPLFIYLMVGIFNTMLADVFYTYVPHERYYMLDGNYRRPPTLIAFMVHLSIAAILGPFMIYLAISSWSFERSIENDGREKSQAVAQNIIEQTKNWNKENIRDLKLKSVLQLGYLSEIAQADTRNTNFRISVAGIESKTVNSSKVKQYINNRYIMGQKIDRVAYDKNNEFYLWMPEKTNLNFGESRWSNTSFVHETDLFGAVIIKVSLPIEFFRSQIFNNYMMQARILLLFTFLVGVFIIVIHRVILRFLSKLLQVSTGLPEKLRSHEGVLWPGSNVFELNELTINFIAMSNDLRNLISEYKSMYDKLEQKTALLLESEQKLHELAYYDVLTGLPNRFNFTDYLKNLLDSLSEQGNTALSCSAAVLLIDLDRFKQVNDTLGHLAGDLLLKSVSERLNGVLERYQRNKRFTARIGGDEFVVILNEINDFEIRQIAESLINEIKKPVDLEGQEVYIGASVGISLFPDDGNNMVDIVKNADLAMYASKESGGNIFKFYSNISKFSIPNKMKLEHGMHKALENKEFMLYYQPKVCAKTGEVSGAEALIRWKHPEDGMIMPDQFISLAEESGLIVPIGEWVLRKACSQLKEWKSKGYPLSRVSVNCSILQFQQVEMPDLINRVLQETGIGPECLELEITESMIMKDSERIISQLLKIRGIGVNVSIDDFGKGYSSLSALKGLPVTCLKIDRSFINNIPDDRHNVAVVEAIIKLAHNIGLGVVAEGVETLDNVNALKTMECDEFQGYYFEKPLPHDKFVQFLMQTHKWVELV
ncbi:putative bifunctional diguanylate cyclase/phosphodiesterase [Pseudobacteroides cellulosolvens]|uniref:Diguanylate cyclase/phosphodiesterase n=1 Tax=Pseudobacteroides cellulosolvens ATCC 35603 = DSM 2933 TaxID=398512 RepID=A0A0L6JSU0_9FIRM|nr:EAL domain-containing protein [Pseudobacteroides cellulosolvens]KNY28492.1 diguanylate cyclase/phosphodiesterase [Pseudobacteroides cellulosolvens ATCC 35603 = DSM 2933]